MFQLIVAVIGIALVVVLSIIAIWVGGTAFTTSGETALFTTYLNQGSQIEAGLKMYQADKGVLPQDLPDSDAVLDHLVDTEYLRTVPEGLWEIDGSTIYRALDDFAQCKRLNEFMGKDVSLVDPGEDTEGCPVCNPPDGTVPNTQDWPGCRKEG